MKLLHKNIWIAFFLLFLTACAITEKPARQLSYSLQAGLNKGGITDNTDMSVIAEAENTENNSPDVFSGATNMGFNVGMHINKPLKYGALESGLDYMYNNQMFTFADPVQDFYGRRNISTNQMMLPLTYNFVLFKHTADIQIKTGYLGQMNWLSVQNTGSLPDYSVNRFSNGVLFGVSLSPFHFEGGKSIGFYADVYRGSQIYRDYYNQASFEMPGSSFFKFGIRYRFK